MILAMPRLWVQFPVKAWLKKSLHTLFLGIFVEKEPKILLKLSSPILYPCVESAR